MGGWEIISCQSGLNFFSPNTVKQTFGESLSIFFMSEYSSAKYACVIFLLGVIFSESFDTKRFFKEFNLFLDKEKKLKEVDTRTVFKPIFRYSTFNKTPMLLRRFKKKNKKT